jgi:hypothetical protein
MKETKLYDYLEISKDSTYVEIKKAYHRQALIYHPDKNPQGTEQFKNITTAWEILGDEKLRKIYDNYGQMGVDMSKQFGDNFPFFLLGGQSQKIFLAAFIFLSIFIALFSLFPIFVALRGDKVVLWNWAVIFIPIWIIHIGAYFFIISFHKYKDGESESVPVYDILLTCKRLTFNSLWIVFYILLVIQLNNSNGEFSGTFIIPLFLIESIIFVENLYGFLCEISIGRRKEEEGCNEGEETFSETLFQKHTLMEKVSLAFNVFLWQISRLITQILFYSKLSDVIISSWSTVFLPIYLFFGYKTIESLVNVVQFSRLYPGSAEDKNAIKGALISKFVMIVIFDILFFSSLGMSVSKADNIHDYYVSTILIPVFIVIGILFFISCCCLPCLIVGSSMDLEEQNSDTSVNENVAGGVVPVIMKRIENKM